LGFQNFRKPITTPRETSDEMRLGSSGPMYREIKRFGIMYETPATRHRGITSLVAFQPHITMSIKKGVIIA
jgi:hypothetical protein